MDASSMLSNLQNGQFADQIQSSSFLDQIQDLKSGDAQSSALLQQLETKIHSVITELKSGQLDMSNFPKAEQMIDSLKSEKQSGQLDMGSHPNLSSLLA